MNFQLSWRFAVFALPGKLEMMTPVAVENVGTWAVSTWDV